MSRILVSLALALFGWSATYGALDTLRYHNPRSKLFYYHGADIAIQAARFILSRPGHVVSLKITLGGAKGKAVVHLYGHEGGISAPILQRDLIRPILVKKNRSGPEVIEIVLAEPILLDNDQFFVAVGQLGPGVTLLSDRQPKTPSCTSSSDDFYYQLIGYKDGIWKWCKYAYAIDAIVEYDESRTKPSGFAKIEGIMGGADSSMCNRSIAWADIDRDGYLDLLAGGHLYHNNNGTSFTDITSTSGISGHPKGNLFIDMNNDRAVDVLFLGMSSGGEAVNSLFINTGDGHFSERSLSLQGVIDPASYSIADVNGDGYLDVFIGQGRQAHGTGNLLLLNDGNNDFIDRTGWIYKDRPSGTGCSGSQWIDYDRDGRLDLFVSRTDGCCELWRNTGDSAYKDVAADVFGMGSPGSCVQGRGADWGDYNNDGTIDLLLPVRMSARARATNSGANITSVYANSGAPAYRLIHSSDETGIEYEEEHAAGVWGDADNDGSVDFLTTTDCACRFLDLYLQRPDHQFELKTSEYGIAGIADAGDAVWVDFDNDGRLDIATFENGRFRLLRNTLQAGNNYIELDFDQQDAGAIGGTVTVYCKGLKYTQQVMSGRGALMQQPLRLHFGLDKSAEVDSIVVERANGGKRESFGPYVANGLYKLRPHMEGVGSEAMTATLNAFPNPFTTDLTITYDLDRRSHVLLQVFSISGELVKTLVDTETEAGEHRVVWQAIDGDRKPLAPGTYIYRLKTDAGEVNGRASLVH